MSTDAIDLGVKIIEHVQNHPFEGFRALGRAEFILAVMREEQMFEQCGFLPGKGFNAANLGVEHLHPDHDMTEEFALIGVLKASQISKFLGFADIVEKRAGHQQLRIDALVATADLAGQFGYGQGMLEEAPR